MIYCVWYPSGGFGHFINAILTTHGKNFVRPNKKLSFSSKGDSHNLDLVVPKYYKGSWVNGFDFLTDQNYCVLIDNGIIDESTRFKQTFPTATTIKVCYDDFSWPVVARTMIDKAMSGSIETELPTDAWNTSEPWARREKYFLFLRDHTLRHSWKQDNENAIYVNSLFDYDTFFNELNSFTEVEPFQELWFQWRKANSQYIDPVFTANDIITCVRNQQCLDISHIQDIWTQSVVYYNIWLEFGIEIPHNDFANFFSNTEQLIDLVK